MISFSMKAATAKVTKNLLDIQRKDIPAAKRQAFKWAGSKGVTKAATVIAKDLSVPKWVIRSGRKGRFAVRLYDTKRDQGTIIFRTKHVNPVGTSKRQSTIHHYKSGAVGVPIRHKYNNAYAKKYRYFESIYVREPNGGVHIAKVKITNAHERKVHHILNNVVKPNFVKRFESQLKYKLKRRQRGA